MKKEVLKYSGLIFLGLLIDWWIIWYSPLNLPKNIPETGIDIEGVLLIGLFLAVLILALKSHLKSHPDTSIFRLTIIGAIICFLPETIFQIVKQFFLLSETLNRRILIFLVGSMGVSLFTAVISFLVAFQLKTKKTGRLILFILGFIILINIIIYCFPAFWDK